MPVEPLPEPWLRGIVPNVHPVTGHLLRAAEQICEDSAKALESVTIDQLWAKPQGMTSAGFHAKHLAGSTRRLCTYLIGDQLDSVALRDLASEGEGTESPAELRAAIDTAFARYREIVHALDPADFGSIREIGRKRIQVTAISLAIHIVEHGQRHTGQLVGATKLARVGKI